MSYTERRKFQKFLIERAYARALDSFDLFAKKMLNMELNMMLIMLMETTFIRHS